MRSRGNALLKSQFRRNGQNFLLDNNSCLTMRLISFQASYFRLMLQRFGFLNFHGVDGSEGMLELARCKSIYQTLQKCMLDSELLPASSDSYDAVVIVGALSGGQVPPAILPELHRVTKPGGFVCMTTRNNTSNQFYKKQLQAVIEEMEQNRLWERVTVQEIEHWEKATAEVEHGSTYISGIIYLYQKSRS
ncbi:methyltransferase-like protein 27 isoform X2 [Stegostoma tigrinum]|uniref:methyltransferase-like protein 27 isoform X2 n=1 Tax=Stegostoma tigrinum TaxID=3053191 RepID=UPI00286FE713|nr:methyltransferase-like protein 27 isoform X2 [Stegostoma tigrinum]